MTGRWEGRELELVVRAEDYHPAHGGGPDLVLLRAPSAGEHEYCCLDAEAAPGDELWIYGYPSGDYRAGDAVRAFYEGPSSREDGTALLRSSGGLAAPGHSGGPALNWRTGAVCGLVRLGGVIGGAVPVTRLIPAKIVLDLFPAVRQAQAGNHTWYGLLSDEQLRAGRHRVPGRRLRDYLRAVRDAAREHPYRLALTDAPQLHTVYLRQWATAESPEAGEHVFEKADEVIERHPGVQIIGEPGVGKSSLLRHIADLTASAWLDGPGGAAVPILVHAGALATRRDLPGALAEGVVAELGPGLGVPRLDEMFAEPPMPGVSWLVLVDGVDEVLDPQRRNQILAVIARHREASPQLRFVLASRPLPRYALRRLVSPDTPTYALERFTSEQLKSFAEGWFSATSLPEPQAMAQTFVARLESSRLRQLARVPLVATMLCTVFVADPGERIPLNRADLYERFVQRLLTKAMEAVDIRAQLHEQARPYGAAAEAAADGLLDTLSARLCGLAHRLQFGVAEHEDEEPARPRAIPEERWQAMLSEPLRQCGLLVERAGAFVFIHQTVQEYLAAVYLADHHPPPRRWRGHDVLVTERQWPWPHAEVMLFLAAIWAGRGGNVKPMLMRLLRRDQIEFVAELANRGVQLPDAVKTRAVKGLRQRVLNPGADNEEWAASRALLVELDSDAAAATLGDLAGDPRAAGFRRCEAARTLLESDQGAGLSALESIARDGSPGNDPLRAARILLEHDPPRALGAFDGIVRLAGLHGSVRLYAGQVLLQHDPERGGAALADFVRDGGAQPQDRLRAALLVADGNEGVLEDLAMHPGAGAAVRTKAARALQARNPAAGIAALRQIAGDARLTMRDRMIALDDLPPADALEVLRANLAALELSIGVREEIVGRLGPLAPDKAAAALAGMLVDRDLGDQDRLRLIKEIGGYDAAQGRSLLKTFAEERWNKSELRLDAVSALVVMSPDDAAGVLFGLSREPVFTGPQRLNLATQLLNIDRRKGLDALVLIAANPAIARTAVKAAKVVAGEDSRRGVALLVAIARDFDSVGQRARAAFAIEQWDKAKGREVCRSLAIELEEKLRRWERKAGITLPTKSQTRLWDIEMPDPNIRDLIRRLWQSAS